MIVEREICAKVICVEVLIQKKMYIYMDGICHNVYIEAVSNDPHVEGTLSRYSVSRVPVVKRLIDFVSTNSNMLGLISCTRVTHIRNQPTDKWSDI